MTRSSRSKGPVGSQRPQPYVAKARATEIRFPVLGVASTCMGTLAAMLLVPEDPVPRWALFPSSLVLALALSLAPVAAAARSPLSLLRGEHLATLAPVYWLLLDPLQGAYEMEGIGQHELRIVFAGIGIFAAATWLGSLGRGWSLPWAVTGALSRELAPQTYSRVAFVAFGLSMLKFAVPCNFNLLDMLRYLGEPRWSAPWGRGQLGGWDALLDHVQYFGYLLPALTVVLARRIGWLAPRTMASGVMALVFALFLAQSGSRRVVGVVLGMALVLWLLTEVRLRARHAVGIVIVAMAILVALQVMLEYRTVGLAAIVSEESSAREGLSRDYLHVDDNIYRFSQVVQLIPDSHPFVYHRYAIWVLVRPIPRVLWPDKPVDPGFDLPSAVGREGVSFSMSAIGEFYMAGGLLAIALGGWLYGRLSATASLLLTQASSFGTYVVYSVFMMALFVGMRSMLELVLTSYAVLAWVALARLLPRPVPTAGSVGRATLR